jgi:hypothetical protein
MDMTTDQYNQHITSALADAGIDLDLVRFTPDGMCWIETDSNSIALGEVGETGEGTGGEWWDAFDHATDRQFDGTPSLPTMAAEIASIVARG